MIKLLDTHQHLVYRDVASYSWAKDIPPLATDNFTVDDYLKLTEGLGVAGTIFMETGVDDPDYQNEAKYVEKLRQNPNNGIKGLIVSIRPEDDSFDSWFEETIGMNVSGYRRILHVMPDDTSQTETFRNNVKKIGKAIGSMALSKDQKIICVGYDGRLSSPSLANELIEGMTSTGINVINIGLCTTPMLYFSNFHLSTKTGVMITGSHNPPESVSYTHLTLPTNREV